MITLKRLAQIEAQGRPVDKFELTGSIRELLMRLDAIATEAWRHTEHNPVSNETKLPIGYQRISAMALGLAIPNNPIASPFKNNMSTAKDQLIFLFTALQNQAHANSRAKGFWQAYDFIRNAEMDHSMRGQLTTIWNLSRTALEHEELGEKTQGERKGLMDDHLPNREMKVCEAADTIIRLMDEAGAHGWPLMEVILEKMAYNETREFMHGKKA